MFKKAYLVWIRIILLTLLKISLRTFASVVLSIMPIVLSSNAQAEVPSAVAPITAEDFFIRGKAAANLDSPGGNYLEKAIQNYTQAIRLKPGFAAAYYERGRAYLEKGDSPKAMENYTQAIRINPNYVLAYYRRGLLHSKLKNFKEAIEDYTQAIRIDRGFAFAYYQRGLIKSQIGNRREAVEDYIQTIRLTSLEKSRKLEKATANYISDFQNNLDFAEIYYRGVAGLHLREPNLRLFRFERKESQEELLSNLTQAIQLNPNSANAYYYRGLARQSPISQDSLYFPFSKDRQEAIVDYTQAIRLKPDFAAAYFERGRAREEDGDILGAIQDQTKTIQLEPNFATLYYQRGFLYSKLGFQQEAVKDLIQALSIDSPNKNGYPKSRQQHIQVLKAQPINAEDYYKRGQVRYTLGDYQGAIWDYTQAIRLKSNFINAYFMRGQAYCEGARSLFASDQNALKNVERSTSDFTQVIQLKPNDASAYYYRGHACGNYYFRGKVQNRQKSVEDFTRAIQLKPDYAEAHYERGYTYYEHGCGHGDPEKAEEDYLQAIRLVGRWTFNTHNEFVTMASTSVISNESTQLRPRNANAYYRRGFNNLALKKKDAIADFTKVIQLNPKDSDAYYGRGFAYYRLKDYVSAIKDLTQAIQLNPDHSDAYLIRSLAHYDSGSRQKAFEDATRAIRVAPDFSEAYFIRGHVRSELGYKPEGDYYMAYIGWPYRAPCGGEPSLQENPTDFYNRGRFLMRRGDKQEAIKNFQQAATLFLVRGNMKSYQETQNLIRQLQR